MDDQLRHGGFLIISETAEKPWIKESIEISASKEAIWQAVTGKETYADWCSAFMPGSWMEGDWSEGSLVRFIGPSDQGDGGMVAKVLEHTPGEILRMQHIAIAAGDTDLYEGELHETWIPAIEEYRLEPTSDGFRLNIASQVPPDYLDWFRDSWSKALARIKILSEQGA